MIKTILVPSLGTEADAAAFAAAAAVAGAFGAHIDAVHVRLDPVEVAVGMTPDTSAATMIEGVVDQLERDAQQRQEQAHQAFAQFCARENLAIVAGASAAKDSASAEWHVEIGREPAWMARYGVAADLIVAARGGPEDATARTILETVLIETGRPLLIPVAGVAPAIPPQRVAIAWKATPQAARAVASALPFLMQAGETVLLSIDEGDAEDEDNADRIGRYLAAHGISAAAQRLKPGSAGGAATLLAAARERADLLVMGGYGHGRVYEWVFSGFTKLALAEAQLPILIAH